MNRFRISIVLFLFTLLMSGKVFSQTTNYDFSTSGLFAYNNVLATAYGPGVYFANISGTVTVDSNTGNILSGTAQKIGSNGNFEFRYLIANDPGYYVLSTTNYNIFVADSSLINAAYVIGAGVNQYGNTNSTRVDSYVGGSYGFAINHGSSALTFVSSTPGAPEIDGSLAPKVGFLLGCLFLMFGRKKEKSEDQVSWLSNQLT